MTSFFNARKLRDMKNFQILLILGFLLQSTLPTSAFALVKAGPTGKTEIKELKLTESVQADEAGAALPRVTQGLRQKKIVFAWVSVYVAQFFTAAKPDFSSIEKLKDSLNAGRPLVVSMTFLRDVGNEKIVNGFKEVFEKTGVDVKADPFSKCLDAVKTIGEVKDHQVLYFVFTKGKDKDTFSAQTNGKEFYSLSDAPGKLDSFLNMWVGTPKLKENGKDREEFDSGLEQLQKQLLKP